MELSQLKRFDIDAAIYKLECTDSVFQLAYRDPAYAQSNAKECDRTCACQEAWGNLNLKFGTETISSIVQGEIREILHIWHKFWQYLHKFGENWHMGWHDRQRCCSYWEKWGNIGSCAGYICIWINVCSRYWYIKELCIVH